MKANAMRKRSEKEEEEEVKVEMEEEVEEEMEEVLDMEVYSQRKMSTHSIRRNGGEYRSFVTDDRFEVIKSIIILHVHVGLLPQYYYYYYCVW